MNGVLFTRSAIFVCGDFMTRASELLFRIEEASTKKLNLSPINVKLSGEDQLRKKNITQSQELKKNVSDKLSTEKPGGNDLDLVAGTGEVRGYPVLIVEVKKSKPYQELVIAKQAISLVGNTIAQMAIKAADAADRYKQKYEALVVAGYFQSGVETKRFRLCVEHATRLVGGKIREKLEGGNQQLYLIG